MNFPLFQEHQLAEKMMCDFAQKEITSAIQAYFPLIQADCALGQPTNKPLRFKLKLSGKDK
jgi:hypothetical protein